MRCRSGAPQQALRDLERAFKNFLTIPERGFPVFKKKGRKDSFYLEGSIKIFQGNYIQLPRIGVVKTYEILPSVPVKNVTISKKADSWYISFKYNFEQDTTEKVGETIGVDIGINTLATCSDGSKFANVKAYKQAKKQLVRHQRAVSKKVIGFLRNATQTKNRRKAVKKLAKVHKKVVNIRADALHKLTTWLAKNHSTIVIEDLNVSGMLKNHKLASAIVDCGFYEFKRQLTYKCEWYGSELVIADRFYPSSQICSNCGHQQKMPLHERTYNCANCGFSYGMLPYGMLRKRKQADRDFNAAVNLENYVNK
ncbi:transposase [Okeania sp. KiyG1]|uniref:RNA-guided endonuclease InsQ/TnpB family protein n=1 Tax=Okeania sp. KiyG1 TaxID=2720165 RepID=UPI0019BDABCF|nr:transposase [Okeania sp. KiyG1]GGA01183.1 transposase [Okeania sp. KiyG1]